LVVVRRRGRRLRPGTYLTLAVAAMLMLVALLGPLGLNFLAMRADWQLSRLEQREDALQAEKSVLAAQVGALSAGPRLEEHADRLGMVPAADIEYVSLPGSAEERDALADATEVITGGASARR